MTDPEHAPPPGSESGETPADGSSSPKRRGLWSVMRSAEQTPSEETSADEPPPAEADAEVDRQSEQITEAVPSETSGVEEPSTAGRGLWSLMNMPVEAEVAPPDETIAPLTDAVSEAVPSLQNLEQTSEPEPDSPQEADSIPVAPSRADVLGVGSAEFERDVHRAKSEERRQERSASRTGLAFLSVALGVVAVLLSALGLRPGLANIVPSSGAGLLAVAVGLSVAAAGRRRTRSRGAAVAAWSGVVLGVLGMTAGPLIFVPLGERNRLDNGHAETVANLERIGVGLRDYHGEWGRYPIGGQFRGETPLHGWMTSLLPHLGHGELYRSLDLGEPYNANTNADAMATLIPEFLAAGGDDALVRDRFAPSHFAGVGGEYISDERGLVNIGLFAPNRDVRSEDITDGLSNTFAAGEVARNLPAWGSPENRRTVERGLNRDPFGFGNAAGTGATFLFVDGSVRFFSNDVDPELLRSLSTRDGGESVDEAQ